MKVKQFLIITVLLIGVAFMAAPAQAQVACWDTQWADQIEVGYEAHGGHYVVNGKWVASGFYFMPLVGSMSSDGPGSRNMGLHGTNSTTYFGDYDNCVFDFQLDSALDGTVTIDCGAGGFTTSGTVTRGTCPIADTADSGPLAGE